MAATAGNKVERAHHMYREGRYTEALGLYSDALSLSKTTPHKIALHSNRAACFLKLHNFKQAADECTSVLELDHNHTGALMLRAQTLVTLKEYQSALFDVNRLLELNPSSEVYQNLQARLKTQLSLAPIPEVETEFEEEDEDMSDTLEGHKELEEDKEGPREVEDTVTSTSETNSNEQSPDPHPQKWVTIPKPKGHSRLDYSRWDSVEDSSSGEDDDDDDDEGTQPQYRFRVKAVDLRSVN